MYDWLEEIDQLIKETQAINSGILFLFYNEVKSEENVTFDMTCFPFQLDCLGAEQIIRYVLELLILNSSSLDELNHYKKVLELFNLNKPKQTVTKFSVN